jgi:hypothetical protein
VAVPAPLLLEEVVLKRRFKRLIALFEASFWVGAGLFF